jgi:threonine synthase
MSIWRWADWMDSVPEAARISLGEGDTPLIRSRSIGPAAGLRNLYFKLETVNPSGSYKDRFAAAAVSHLRATGRRRCIATSSGNTGAALAAYCAAAGVRCEIAIVETAPVDKLRQMLAYGAELFRVRGFGLDPDVTQKTFSLLQEWGGRGDAALVISAFRYCPVGMSGVQSISYELAEQLPERIDHVFCCAGGGGLTLAVARGFLCLHETGRLKGGMPRVECVQPEGNATIAGPLRQGRERAEAVTCTTAISGLQVPSVIDGDAVLPACRTTKGWGHLVADEFVWQVQARLAREEGIFCEPAAAVPLAGALQARAEGGLAEDATVVCLVTGVGFKDAASVERMVVDRPCPLLDPAELADRFRAAAASTPC